MGCIMADGKAAVWSALGASVATLVCCALPSLLVLLGFGTTVAAAVSAAPWLVSLSQYKLWAFLVAGLLIVGSRLYALRLAPRVTPEGAACRPELVRATRIVWTASVVLWSVGFFVAYALGPLLSWSYR